MNITIYTKTGCPWCNGVLDFLNEKGINYTEKEVTGNRQLFDEMVAKSGQKKAPVLDIDGYILADTDRDAVEKYLKEKGVLEGDIAK
jgi:glutaredoxin 3